MQIIFPFFDVLKLLIVGILEHFGAEVAQGVHCQICTKKAQRPSPFLCQREGLGRECQYDHEEALYAQKKRPLLGVAYR
jgi:hypothetical protein